MNFRSNTYAVILVAAMFLAMPFIGPYIGSRIENLTAALIQSTTISVTGNASGTAAPSLASYIPNEIRENSSDYKFINPLLFVETDKKLFSDVAPLASQISSYIKSAVNTHRADSVSVYFRDMNTGHWTGVNEDKLYEPSSMLKVAVMIAWVRKAENDAANSSTTVDSYLEQELYYPGPDSTGQAYPPIHTIPAGMYSIKNLIRQMIVESDNVALNVLLANNMDEFQRVFKDFRLPQQPTGPITDYMTAKSYSVIFRTLYSATYIPWDISEKALRLLTQTTFNKGLVAGVPAGTVVAHKFGEHTNTGSGGNVMWHELHDCGIIYYPGRPYLLCVMSSGQDFSKLETVISDISTMTYNYIPTLPPLPKN